MRKLTPDTIKVRREVVLDDEPASENSNGRADTATIVAPRAPESFELDAPTHVPGPARLSPRRPAPLPVIDGYEILGVLGRGGMGVVYRARQTKLGGRLVALKMVLAGNHADEGHVSRFRKEAKAAAGLQHPNIVRIYDQGDHEDFPYFSMEYVAGGSLDQKINGTPWPSRRAAHLVEILARAMHAAHEHGIVHRDLKPSNVLLAPSDALHGVKLDNSPDDSGYFEPKISDFGLAKVLGDTGRQTQSGAVIGTPEYMSPEQAGGKKTQIGPASDIYSLGAILYELLTARPPFVAETPVDTLMEVIEQDAAPPRLINAKVDRDVETICLKCLEKDPENRYATALALAEDLRQYRRGEPITARSFNIFDRIGRTLERSRHAMEFYSYAKLLHFFAAIILLVEMVVHLIVQTEQWVFLLPMTRFCQLSLMGLVLWRHRSARAGPSSPSEQQMWSIWIGYTATCTLLGLTGRLMNGLAVEWELTLYPSLAAVTGLIFFIMGSNYWGRCYAFGIAFFVLAPLMSYRIQLAPLAFGGLWAGSLVAIGRHLQRLGARAAHKSKANCSLLPNSRAEPTSD